MDAQRTQPSRVAPSGHIEGREQTGFPLREIDLRHLAAPGVGNAVGEKSREPVLLFTRVENGRLKGQQERRPITAAFRNPGIRAIRGIRS